VSTQRGGWAYRWVQEDAFINFRIIGNLLSGHGPVFNVGERVEVYSDPIWMFLLAGIHWLIPSVSLEWMSVILGLLFTGMGFVLAGRAAQRLAASRGDLLVFPIGLLIVSVVAGVWEFSTSGLEMGTVFGWIDLSFWLLVRTESKRTSAAWCAFVAGLGALFRPELVLMSVIFLVGLAAVVAAPDWKGPLGPSTPCGFGTADPLRTVADGLLCARRLEHGTCQVGGGIVVVTGSLLPVELHHALRPVGADVLCAAVDDSPNCQMVELGGSVRRSGPTYPNYCRPCGHLVCGALGR
jgi:hypothetical protein